MDFPPKRGQARMACWILGPVVSGIEEDPSGKKYTSAHEETNSKMKSIRGAEWPGTFYNFALSDWGIFTCQSKPSWRRAQEEALKALVQK